MARRGDIERFRQMGADMLDHAEHALVGACPSRVLRVEPQQRLLEGVDAEQLVAHGRAEPHPRRTSEGGNHTTIDLAVGADQPDAALGAWPVQQRHPFGAGMEAREATSRAARGAVIVADAGVKQYGVAPGDDGSPSPLPNRPAPEIVWIRRKSPVPAVRQVEYSGPSR